MRTEKDRDALIEWKSEPPSMIKCVPEYKRPEWVPGDQGL
jgi:hypothetical protein